MNTTGYDQTRNVLGQSLGTMILVGGLTLLGWAAIIAPGCEGHGTYTKKAMSGAKIKMEGLKSATEYKMAEQAYFAGELPKAIKHIEISISLNDNVAKSYVMLGRIRMEMGDVEGAQAAFEHASKVDAKSVDSQYFQGILAERIDRHEEAMAHYQAACELDPSNPQYAIAAAEMMIEAGDLAKAETFLLGRRNTFDHNAGIRQTLGHIELMKNDAAQAATLFNEAHMLAPDDQSITEDLIRAQVAVGKFPEAEYNLARLLTNKDNKDRHNLLAMRAGCLVQLDRPVEARAILLTLTQSQEGAADVDAWINLGQVSYTLTDLNHLRQASSRLIAIAPQRPEGYILRALNLRKTGKLDEARRNVETAINLQQSSESYVLLGMILQDQNNHEGAKQSYAAALRQNPGDPHAGKLLSAIDTVAHVE